MFECVRGGGVVLFLILQVRNVIALDLTKSKDSSISEMGRPVSFLMGGIGNSPLNPPHTFSADGQFHNKSTQNTSRDFI